RFPDARHMIELGVPVALGTDFNPNCPVEDMQLVLSLACYCMKMTQAEALSAATLNSAHAVGLSGQVGSIEPGKKADLVVLDAPSHEHLGYRLGTNLVRHVVKAGRIVVEDGKLAY
ncbi:MAG TPA: imidazolonepropionase, partial [Candidatus Bathyarchaeota archaeon]|nr:imidazolonepropionase [Candidatus Bathyarchaeota archaeon]